MHTLIYIGLVSLLEIAIWMPLIWKHARKLIAVLVIIGLAIGCGLLVGNDYNVWALLFAFVSVYRVINLLRIIEGRTPADYLCWVSFRTSLVLIGSQIIIGACVIIDRSHVYTGLYILDVLRLLDCLGVAFLVLITIKHIREIQPIRASTHIPERDAPTLSILIPARNETDDLKYCLDSLISSNYPKLEIIVLDDCSQDKHTPEIIKDFAHAGVRFIAGEEPPDHWLAKNFAYEQLAKEANGDILLFCGVDTRFEPHTVQTIVESFIASKVDMMSILPKNSLAVASSLESYLIQPVRYAWEISIPRNWLRRPPVLSTCWIISTKVLKKHGMFKSIKNSSSVESYFAKIAASRSEGYRFYQSQSLFGLSASKGVPEQRATAIRTRYPQTHRRPEIVMALSLIELLLLLIPYVLLVQSIVQLRLSGIILGAVAILLASYLYTVLMDVAYSKKYARSIWLAPIAVAYDVCLLNYSMWMYEFREVLWKDRNICIPVMQYGGQERRSSS